MNYLNNDYLELDNHVYFDSFYDLLERNLCL
jgi:hypothetical protein